MAGATKAEAPVGAVRASAYRVPTDRPEADGTLSWDATTLVLVEVDAGGRTGLGFSYTARAAATVVSDLLAGAVLGRDALAIPACFQAMVGAIRNVGRPGLAATAVSAVDVALWDLKGKLLGVSVADLLGRVRPSIPAYGSGGFTSYTLDELREQLSAWVESGLRWVKMKVGSRPGEDLRRVEAAREAIGPDAGLFVDANGAYAPKEALAFADAFSELGVEWFEEPVSSDDLEGLRLLRDRAPAGMEIAAGEYGYDLWYFRRMLEAGAVDILMADATRCGGFSGFAAASALCVAYGVPLSAHTAPSLHAHACCASPAARHLEYFHDHARIERLLFDGALDPVEGALAPDRSRPGLGLARKSKDAARFAL